LILQSVVLRTTLLDIKDVNGEADKSKEKAAFAFKMRKEEALLFITMCGKDRTSVRYPKVLDITVTFSSSGPASFQIPIKFFQNSANCTSSLALGPYGSSTGLK
jgi:hypothetical protein